MIAELVSPRLHKLPPPVQRRLARCLPMLEEALNNWVRQPRVDVSAHCILAAATVKGGLVVAADTWPEIDLDAAARIERDALLRATVDIIEAAAPAASVFGAWLAVLGRSGVAQARVKAAQARAAGMIPLHVLLIERDDGDPAVATMVLPLTLRGDSGVRH
jgi:hypothetical protein